MQVSDLAMAQHEGPVITKLLLTAELNVTIEIIAGPFGAFFLLLAHSHHADSTVIRQNKPHGLTDSDYFLSTWMKYLDVI